MVPSEHSATEIETNSKAEYRKGLEELGKLKQENESIFIILVMGKGGVGKSLTVNSIKGERAVIVSAFQASCFR